MPRRSRQAAQNSGTVLDVPINSMGLFSYLVVHAFIFASIEPPRKRKAKLSKTGHSPWTVVIQSSHRVCASVMLVRIVSPRFFASYSSSKPLVKNGATPTARNASVQHCFARHTLLSGLTSSQRPIANLGTESSMVLSRN
jgi:hypothetical protein